MQVRIVVETIYTLNKYHAVSLFLILGFERISFVFGQGPLKKLIKIGSTPVKPFVAAKSSKTEENILPREK